MHIVLSCYIQRRGDQWEAVCPNLNHTAQGQTFLEAYEVLGRRMQEYVSYVEVLPALAPASALGSRTESVDKEGNDNKIISERAD